MPPAYEVLLLNTAIPQIQAAQSGDTYVVPRDIAINATAIISANSATDALRITQTGAGNAILVEDSANPDSTPFVVTAAGDVGVGTPTPSSKLTVAGDSLLSVASGNIGYGWLSGTTNYSLYLNAADNSLRLYSSVGTAGDKLTLDSSGNLGLGVTPSAWGTGSSVRALQLTQGAVWGFGAANMYLGANNFFNGTDRIYLSNNTAGEYRILGSTYAWMQAAIGTAGNAITFTQAMTLDASGNLGVGITSPFTRLDSASARTTTLNSIASFNTMPASVTDTTAFALGVGGGINFRARLNSSGYSTLAAIWSYRESGITDDYKGSLILGTADNTTGYPNERARITSGGELLVGAQSLYGSASNTGTYEWSKATGNGGEGGFVFRNSSTSTNSDVNPVLIISKESTTTTSDQRFIQFYVNGLTQPMGGIVGNGATNVQFVSLSDAREKENIQPVTGALARVCSINVVSFDRKGSGDHVKAGFIAQNVLPVYPEYVVENASDSSSDPRYGITGGMSAGYIAELTAALQELKAEVDRLKVQLKGA